VFGVWIEEFDPLCGNGSEEAEGEWGTFRCLRWCDAIHLDGARATATFRSGFCAGGPAITEHNFGDGRAIYVGTAPEDGALEETLWRECERLDIAAPLDAPAGVEVTRRWAGAQPQTWVLNHNEAQVTLRLPDRMTDLLSESDVEGEARLNHGETLLLVPQGRDRRE
jgi:beta-galactosidase